MTDRPASYRPQTTEGLGAYLAAQPALATALGGAPHQWQIEEVGDGNLNLVFKVRGPRGGLAVKQALPYVRLVGESWPLPLSRAHFEHLALTQQARVAPGLVPALHHYDAEQALIAMELLEPHAILRRGMIAGRLYPQLAADLSRFAAQTLFATSDLALPAAEKKALIAAFAGNDALCKITEDLIFTEPYRIAANNRWTSPQLDGWAERIREDAALKLAVSRLKLKFMSSAEALIHGDLHTGSVMVTETDTRVIDPEFAFVGPMGFDLGAVLANLLLNFFSQRGHERRAGERSAYRAWVLQTAQAFWSGFAERFLALWRSPAARGDAYPAALFATTEAAAALEGERRAYLQRLFGDTLGFAGAKMIRRILGLAHNVDLEWIENPDLRAACEARALTLARELLLAPAGFVDLAAVCRRAEALEAAPPTL